MTYTFCDFPKIPIKNKVVKHNFVAISPNISEILFSCNIYAYEKQPDNQIIFESKYNYKSKVTFNSTICPFTINYIPNDHPIKLIVTKKIKIHLTAEKVLAKNSQGNTEIALPNLKSIAYQYEDLPKLEREADANFMRDYLICQNHKLPFPKEIMALIGYYVNGDIKAFRMDEGCNISAESCEHHAHKSLLGIDFGM